MIRLVVFLVLTVAFISYVAIWLAGLPGTVAVTWLGYRADVPVGLFSAVIACAAALAWSLFLFVLRAPRRLASYVASRRAAAGHQAIVHGLMAIGAGNVGAARRFAARAARLAPGQPLLLMLQAQTAQLSGESEDAATAFRAMADRRETRLFGLHGLFIEAQRSNDLEAAREHAEAAAKASPSLAWAGQAALEFRCRDSDWPGALEALERNRRGGLIPADAYKRQRAVLLTAQALALKDSNPDTASDMAQEAAKLSPELVPAAALAGRLLAEAGEQRKAARVLEGGWRNSPHPDIAGEYADLVPGASARDRLARVRQLARLIDPHPESALALANAALDANEFAEARDSLAPLLGAPTRRVATLMARIEAAENGDTGRAREWMARAVHAAHDPVWTADGVIAERWMPVSPVTGRLDAFQWRVPVADLSPPRGPVIEQWVAVERTAAVPVAAPILPAMAEPRVVDVTSAPVSPAQTPEPAKPEPRELTRLNGPIEPTPVRLPDDPGPAALEPGLDPVPKPGSEFSRGLVK
jgi:HemY protein